MSVHEEWAGDFNAMADPEERKHLLSVLDGFRSYRRLAHYNTTHLRRRAFYSLPSSHWTLLSKAPFSLLDSYSKVDDLIDSNAELAEAIFCAGFQAFVAPTLDSELVASIVPKTAREPFEVYGAVMDHLNAKTTVNDAEKARSCVNQFWREWSAEGADERAKCFAPILSTIEQEFSRQEGTPHRLPSKKHVQVLVPGAGLGRLVFDLCKAGYSVEGNEISYQEIMASSLVLNHMQKARQFSIAPFALNFSNHLKREDQFRTVEVPDVHPATELANGNFGEMSMSTGDFCVLYSKHDYKDAFDVVASVFFIDTAPNLIRYIEAVRNSLKTGGIWINLGPLLWHHAARPEDPDDESRKAKQKKRMEEDSGIGDPGSFELTDEEVVALIQHFGFEIEKHEPGSVDTGYITNPKSMLQSTYRASFWVARKIALE